MTEQKIKQIMKLVKQYGVLSGKALLVEVSQIKDVAEECGSVLYEIEKELREAK